MNQNTKNTTKHSLILMTTLILIGVVAWLWHSLSQVTPITQPHHHALVNNPFPVAPKTSRHNPLAKSITGILFDQAHPEQSSLLVHTSQGDEEIRNHSTWGKHGSISIIDDTHVRLTKGKKTWVLGLGW